MASMASNNSSTTRHRTVRPNIPLRSRPRLGNISRNTPLRSRPRPGNRVAHTTTRQQANISPPHMGPMRQASITVSIGLTRESHRRTADPEQRTSRPTARQVPTSSLNRRTAGTTSNTRHRHQPITHPTAPCRRRHQLDTRARLRTTVATLTRPPFRRAIIRTKASQASKGATPATGSKSRGNGFGDAFRTLRT